MKLRDLDLLDLAERDLVIFAKRPWSPSSDCILVDGEAALEGSPADGFAYFLETTLLGEVLEGRTGSDEEMLATVIHYAEHDAWPEPSP